MKKFFALLLIVAAQGLLVRAANVYATTGSYTNVQTALATCNPGDTLILPAGSNDWTAGITLTGVAMIGQGTNSTIIADDTPSGYAAALVSPIIMGTNFSRVSGIQFIHGFTNTPWPNAYNSSNAFPVNNIGTAL